MASSITNSGSAVFSMISPTSKNSFSHLASGYHEIGNGGRNAGLGRWYELDLYRLTLRTITELGQAG